MIFGFNTDVKVGTVVYHVQSEARQKDLLLQTQVFVKGQCIGKCTSPFPEEPVLLDFAEDSIQESLKAQHRRLVAAVRAGTLEQELGAGAPEPLPDKQIAAAAVGGPVPPFPPPEASSFDLSDLPLPAFEDIVPAAPPQEVRAQLEPPPAREPSAPVAPGCETVPAPAEAPSPARQGEPLLASAEGLATGSLKIECTSAHWAEEEQSLLLVLQVHREQVPLDYAALTLRIACGQGRPHYAYSSTDGNGLAAVAITIDDASGREAKVLVQAEGEGESATRRFHLRPLV